ncbi:nucleotidyltransferase family protein [Methanogenium marinum]|uniref:nucleotidyltransferase family protein n=1 Tax=Methanogenium marinum TaxID=348610 RepID=UPI003B84AED2
MEKYFAVLIFGSYARGEEKQYSDIDVCIVRKEYWDSGTLLYDEIYQALEKQVPMCYSLFGRRLTKFCNRGLIRMFWPHIRGNTRLILMHYNTEIIIYIFNCPV